MKKPKFRIGDNVIFKLDSVYHLVKIIRAYSNCEEKKWLYWTSISGDIGYFVGYISEKDIIKI